MRLPISVVVPAYNAGSTLSRAIDSVFAQTRLPAEIIVVDDGSRDSTWHIIQKLCADHPDQPMKSVQLAQNGGAGAARNAGWAMASQEFVAFLDADDAWHPRKLELQYRWLVDHPAVVLCGHRCVVVDGAEPYSNLPTGDQAVYFYSLASFLIANRLSTPSVMLRRHVSERFVNGKRCSEDYLLWIQIVAHHGPAAFIDLPLAFLFKPRYGATGLSGDLWRMHVGELDTLSRLRREKIVGFAGWFIIAAWLWAKFIRRAVGNFLAQALTFR